MVTFTTESTRRQISFVELISIERFSGMDRFGPQADVQDIPLFYMALGARQ